MSAPLSRSASDPLPRGRVVDGPLVVPHGGALVVPRSDGERHVERRGRACGFRAGGLGGVHVRSEGDSGSGSATAGVVGWRGGRRASGADDRQNAREPHHPVPHADHPPYRVVPRRRSGSRRTAVRESARFSRNHGTLRCAGRGHREITRKVSRMPGHDSLAYRRASRRPQTAREYGPVRGSGQARLRGLLRPPGPSPAPGGDGPRRRVPRVRGDGRRVLHGRSLARTLGTRPLRQRQQHAGSGHRTGPQGQFTLRADLGEAVPASSAARTAGSTSESRLQGEKAAGQDGERSRRCEARTVRPRRPREGP